MDTLQLETNIKDCIKSMKKQGTCGASYNCLKQCVSTRNLTMPVQAFHNSFKDCVNKVVKGMKGFEVYD